MSPRDPLQTVANGGFGASDPRSLQLLGGRINRGADGLNYILCKSVDWLAIGSKPRQVSQVDTYLGRTERSSLYVRSTGTNLNHRARTTAAQPSSVLIGKVIRQINRISIR